MMEPVSKDVKSSHSTSESVPRAVEFLINLVIRWICFALSAGFGVLTVCGAIKSWTLWVVVPTLALSLFTFVIAILNKPRGKIVFDRTGPAVMVPKEQTPVPISKESQQAP